MSEQRQSLSPAERDRLLIRDLVFAPPGPGKNVVLVKDPDTRRMSVINFRGEAVALNILSQRTSDKGDCD